MDENLVLTLLIASAAAYGLAVLSAVAGFGGGVLRLPLLITLFGLRVAVPVLTLTQIASNASRVWLNRDALQSRLIGRFCFGAVPFAIAGALVLATAPLAGLYACSGPSWCSWSSGGGCDRIPTHHGTVPLSPSAPALGWGLRCWARSAR